MLHQCGVFVGDPFKGEFSTRPEARSWPVFCHYTMYGRPANEIPFDTHTLSLMVSYRVKEAGYPDHTFSTHSLRVGMATGFVL
jgi:hypothetical protein